MLLPQSAQFALECFDPDVIAVVQCALPAGLAVGGLRQNRPQLVTDRFVGHVLNISMIVATAAAAANASAATATSLLIA